MEVLSADNLEQALRDLIVDSCNIPDASEEVFPDAPLIGPDSPWGLDSLDAVEIVVAVQKAYEVRIGGQDTSREVLASLRTLAEFIRKERG
ncbi:phosphopantetheine-binding protein [Desulfuromonas acetexigens]|uniref:Acyl carrier protein n=1 Tax=Trichloromonas acetexigens TaxID=38815 RepID=A0A550JF68_9BACT|nr:phosphopantetheine-binding protein [Desulfuromonas acetexigens]TRO81835.1 acyl carrier protein [Desulfuromonas acetexigens]